MSYYSSNQKKQAAYLNLRKGEEVNSNIQQNKLYQKLALERGEIEQATNLARLASSVFNKAIVSNPPVPKVDGISVLAKAVSNGTLDQVVKNLGSVNDPSLSQAANNVKKLINDPAFKASVNEKLSQVVELQKSQPKKVANILIEEMTKSPLFNRMKEAQEGVDELASLAGSETGSDIQPSIQTIISNNENDYVNSLPEVLKNKILNRSNKVHLLVGITKTEFNKLTDDELLEIANDTKFYDEFMNKSNYLKPNEFMNKSKPDFKNTLREILEIGNHVVSGSVKLDEQLLKIPSQ